MVNTAPEGGKVNTPNICFVEDSGRNPGLPNAAGTLVLGANSHCNVEFTKKGRQTARTFVTAGIADPTPGCAGAKKNPFYGSADLNRLWKYFHKRLTNAKKAEAISLRYDYGWTERRIADHLRITKTVVHDWLVGNGHRRLVGNSTTFTHLEGDCLVKLKDIPDQSVDKHLLKTSDLQNLPNDLLTKGFVPNTHASAGPGQIFAQGDSSADFVDFGNLAENHELLQDALQKLPTALPCQMISGARGKVITTGQKYQLATRGAYHFRRSPARSVRGHGGNDA